VEGSFRPGQPGLRKLLGDLEAEIMEVVWSQPPASRVTVRDVYETLRERRKVAYTTVMTVMGILAKKGILAQEEAGRAYQYWAPQDRETFTSRAVGAIVSDLMADFSDAAIASFARVIEGEAPAADTITRLRERIDEARRPEKE
jgi:predicted transcriptional regulator